MLSNFTYLRCTEERHERLRYRAKDGRFEEFDVNDDRKDEFVLHDRDFHGHGLSWR